MVLDALNQLDDRDGAPDLVWLPPHIPENVRMFLSTLPGRSLEEIKKRGWPVLTIEPLQPEERKQLIKEYLALFTKTLGKDNTERIASSEKCQNPLFLRVLLDELRQFGMHEGLGDQIKKYLKAPSIPALYELILKRCEQDYERERPALVRDAMSLLWAARRGLSEVELMELLGANGQPLPRAYWSPLYLAIEQSFLSRGGLIGFAHDYLRQAVEDRYLSKEKEQRNSHIRLADYFEAQPAQSSRRLDELPWQLAQAKEWQRLYALLEDLEFFKSAWDFNPWDVKAYWTEVELDSPYRMLDAYRRVVDHPGQHQDHVWYVGTLLKDTGHLKEAFTLRSYLVEYYRKARDKVNLQVALGNQALILKARGDMDGAMALHKEEERICRELGNKDGLQRTLGNQANILYARGDLNGAMALHKQEEHICRELGNKYVLQISLGNQANILYVRGDLDGAMALHKEEERICRELGNKDGLQRTLGNQAQILNARGDMDGAMAFHKEEERICRELGNKDGLQRTLGNQAYFLHVRGDLDGAMALHKEEERICRELGNKDELQASLGNQALILKARGDMDGAMALHKEEERICRELGNKYGLQYSLGNQANILAECGDPDGSMALHKEEEHICRELGNKDGLQRSLGNQANILAGLGDLDGAMALHKEKERICRELGLSESLAFSLINQAVILIKKGKKGEAHHLAEESFKLAQKYGYRSLAQYIDTTRNKLGF